MIGLPPLRKLVLLVCVAIALACYAYRVDAQVSVSSLKTEHAIALEKFLSSTKGIDFLAETAIDEEYREFMRESFGKSMTPYYKVADFNADGVEDFAMILTREGKLKVEEGLAESHKYRHPLLIVIFNGLGKGEFDVAHKREIESPLVGFLHMTYEKKSRLYFAIAETDYTLSFTPVGKGYIVE